MNKLQRQILQHVNYLPLHVAYCLSRTLKQQNATRRLFRMPLIKSDSVSRRDALRAHAHQWPRGSYIAEILFGKFISNLTMKQLEDLKMMIDFEMETTG